MYLFCYCAPLFPPPFYKITICTFKFKHTVNFERPININQALKALSLVTLLCMNFSLNLINVRLNEFRAKEQDYQTKISLLD